jgi:hypothetical protein
MYSVTHSQPIHTHTHARTHARMHAQYHARTPQQGYGKVVGGLLLFLNLSALVSLMVVSGRFPDNKLLGLAEVFYRIGASIFGGGNVILAM